MRQVVDELGPDALQPSKLGDILEEEPRAVAARRGLGADDQYGPIRPSRADLAARPSRVFQVSAVGERLDGGVHEGFHRRPADKAGRVVAKQGVRSRVGLDDAEVPVEADQPHLERVAQRIVLGDPSGEVALPSGLLRAQAFDGRFRVLERAYPTCIRDDRSERRRAQQNGDDGTGLHGPSIAHRRPPSLPPAGGINGRGSHLPTAPAARSDRRAMGPRGARTPAPGRRGGAPADERSARRLGAPR